MEYIYINFNTMKYSILIIALLVSTYAFSQEGSKYVIEMAKLAPLVGEWQGEGWIQQRNERIEFKQTEHVQLKLESTTLLIEGIGYIDGEVGFQAMAIASFDPANGNYRFNSFLNDGKYTQAAGIFKDDGSFEWSFDVPNGGTVKYIMAFTADTWKETGHFSQDGTQWFPFMEMNLTKTKN